MTLLVEKYDRFGRNSCFLLKKCRNNTELIAVLVED